MEIDVMAHLGLKLRDRRKSLGLTQGDVAAAVGVRFQQIHKYECGACTPPASRLPALASVLGVSPGYFFEGLSEALQTR